MKTDKEDAVERLQVEEVIVVEGRDDTNAVMKAIDGMTIETHGFGIKNTTWKLLDRAYEQKGLIIFTDPDYAGEEIRRRLTEKFPGSKQAYLIRTQAEKKGDIGIENASPEDIKEAIKKARYTHSHSKGCFSEGDMFEFGLVGRPEAGSRRQALGSILGIGYSNGKTFLRKLNQMNISREEFERGIQELDEAICTNNG